MTRPVDVSQWGPCGPACDAPPELAGGWTLADGPKAKVRKVDLGQGAPGHRKTPDGQLWVSA
jgi:hypothetical protein